VQLCAMICPSFAYGPKLLNKRKCSRIFPPYPLVIFLLSELLFHANKDVHVTLTQLQREQFPFRIHKFPPPFSPPLSRRPRSGAPPPTRFSTDPSAGAHLAAAAPTCRGLTFFFLFSFSLFPFFSLYGTLRCSPLRPEYEFFPHRRLCDPEKHCHSILYSRAACVTLFQGARCANIE